MRVSVVLPTYNEAANILPLIEAILKDAPDDRDVEIIVVDDNSPDGTHQIVRNHYANQKSVRCLRRTKNRGFANSIREGIDTASGEVVVVMDSDFTHEPKEIPKMLHMEKIFDLVTGSRFCAGGNMQDKAHYLASFCFNLFLRIILKTQIQDNLGGFFCIQKQKLKDLPLEKIFYGYGDYFFRLLFYAEKKGYSIIELPCLYMKRKKGASKSKFINMLFSYSWMALKTRIES
jgi:dolichol-phosphate mannosyltransferase